MIELMALVASFAVQHSYGEPCPSCVGGRFICVDYARHLAQLLDENGYESRVVSTRFWKGTTIGHAWTRVYLANGTKLDFEPENGKVIQGRAAQCTRYWYDRTSCGWGWAN